MTERFTLHSWPDALNVPYDTCPKGDACEYRSMHIDVVAASDYERRGEKIIRQADTLFAMQRKMHTLKGDLEAAEANIAAMREVVEAGNGYVHGKDKDIETLGPTHYPLSPHAGRGVLGLPAKGEAMKNPYMDFDLELARQNLDSAAIAMSEGNLGNALLFLDLALKLLQHCRRIHRERTSERQPTGYYTRNVEE